MRTALIFRSLPSGVAMKHPIVIGTLFGMLMVPGAALADHICTNSPDEVFVGYSQGGNGVAPMPICRVVSGQGQQGNGTEALPPRVVDRWEVFDDRFGAVAVSPADGAYGTSFDQPSAQSAEQAAMDQCIAGGGASCSLVGQPHRHACSTMAWGAGVAVIEGGETDEISRERSLDSCAEKTGSECEVIKTFCSTPVSRWVYEKPKNFVPAQR